MVLEAIRESGMKLKRSKCVWGKSYVEFLGHKIGNGTLAVPEQRVTAMKDFQSKKDLRAFLGSIGYYRRFIPNFTSSKAPGQVIWSMEMVDAFHQLCVSLCDFSVLNVPIMSDAYVRAVGSKFEPVRPNKPHPPVLTTPI